MKKRKASLITMCVAASLFVSTFGATAVLADEEEDSAAAEAAAQAEAEAAAAAAQAEAEAAAAAQAEAEAAAAEQAAAEQAAAEQAAAEQAAAEQAAADRTIVSTNTVYDCDGSGNGYYEYIYSDGSIEYEDFYASGSGGSSDTYYEEPSYEETYYEEPVYEEPVAEESSNGEAAAAENSEVIFDGTEWSVEQIASIPDVVTGVEDKEYTAGSASRYDIHMGVDFDSDIVRGVLFRTCDVDCSTPGEYDMTYLVYFDREALLDYMEENGIDAEDFPGLEDDSSDRIEIDVNGKVVIN